MMPRSSYSNVFVVGWVFSWWLGYDLVVRRPHFTVDGRFAAVMMSYKVSMRARSVHEIVVNLDYSSILEYLHDNLPGLLMTATAYGSFSSRSVTRE